MLRAATRPPYPVLPAPRLRAKSAPRSQKEGRSTTLGVTTTPKVPHERSDDEESTETRESDEAGEPFQCRVVHLDPEEGYQRHSHLEQTVIAMTTRGVHEHIGEFIRQLDAEHGSLGSARAMALHRALLQASERIDPHDGTWERHETEVGQTPGSPGNEEERRLRHYASWIQTMVRRDDAEVEPAPAGETGSRERYEDTQRKFQNAYKRETLFKEAKQKTERAQQLAIERLDARGATLRAVHETTLGAHAIASQRAIAAAREMDGLTQETKSLEQQIAQSAGYIQAHKEEAREALAEYRRRDSGAAVTLIQLVGDTATLSHASRMEGRTFHELQDITQLLASIGADDERHEWRQDMEEVYTRYNDCKHQFTARERDEVEATIKDIRVNKRANPRPLPQPRESTAGLRGNIQPPPHVLAEGPVVATMLTVATPIPAGWDTRQDPELPELVPLDHTMANFGAMLLDLPEEERIQILQEHLAATRLGNTRNGSHTSGTPPHGGASDVRYIQERRGDTGDSREQRRRAIELLAHQPPGQGNGDYARRRSHDPVEPTPDGTSGAAAHRGPDRAPRATPGQRPPALMRFEPQPPGQPRSGYHSRHRGKTPEGRRGDGGMRALVLAVRAEEREEEEQRRRRR